MNERSRLLWVWLSIGFIGCAVLLYSCLMPSPPNPEGLPWFDKLEHFLAFAILGTWFAGLLPRRYAGVLIALAAFALAIELMQGLVAYRNGDILDFVADSLGILAGIGVAHLGAMRWVNVIDRHVSAKRNLV